MAGAHDRRRDRVMLEGAAAWIYTVAEQHNDQPPPRDTNDRWASKAGVAKSCQPAQCP